MKMGISIRSADIVIIAALAALMAFAVRIVIGFFRDKEK